MEIIQTGEKLHIMERRFFENDPRRHFIGEVLASAHDIIRLRGVVWVYDTIHNKYVKKPETRERVMVLGERHIVNVLPPSTIIENMEYVSSEIGHLVVTDHAGYSLDVNEFGHSR